MAPALEHFRRSYGDFTAVEDLSFAVHSGEIVGLIGPNGAGKTTTLRALAGILKPSSGRISIDGHERRWPVWLADGISAARRRTRITRGPVANGATGG